MVRVPSSTRVGPTCFIAGWWAGANMKPMPGSRRQWEIASGERSMRTPSAARTSAAPQREESARLPCLATGTLAPATTKAAQVEMLNEPDASPPVPTTSTASAGASTASIFDRMVRTAPVISSTVSPRTLSAISNPPICEGVASPDIMRSNACADSSSVSAAPLATLAMSALSSSISAAPPLMRGRPPAGLGIPGRGKLEKILQDQMPVLRGDAFRVELHAMDRQPRVRNAHDEMIVGFRRQCQLVRYAGAVDHERMVARGLERRVDAAEHAAAPMPDLGELAVDGDRRAHDPSAERLPDRLVAETHAENRNARRGLVDEIEADARLIGSARAGREHDRVRIGREHVGARELIVAMHHDLRAQSAEIMDEVEGEAVVIVDQYDHFGLARPGLSCRGSGGQGGGGTPGEGGQACRIRRSALLGCSSNGRLSAVVVMTAFMKKTQKTPRADRSCLTAGKRGGMVVPMRSSPVRGRSFWSYITSH